MEVDWLQMLKAGIGTLVAILLGVAPFVMFVRDVTQKKHTVPRRPGRRPLPLRVRGAPRVLPAVLLRERPCGDAVQPRRALVGLPARDEQDKEIDMIAHSCGVRHGRALERRHVRRAPPAGGPVALDVPCPLPPSVAAKNA